MAQENITPLARQLAEENGLDWRRITGSGPDGLVLEGDVLEYLAGQLTHPTPPVALEPPAPPSFEIDLNPQPPAHSSSEYSPGTAWPTESPTDDQPLVWGKPPAVSPVAEVTPPVVVEEALPPVAMPEVSVEGAPPPPPADPDPAVPPVVEAEAPPLANWQPVALWQRWVATENASQAARALSQAWGTSVELPHLLLRAAQLVHRQIAGQGQVLRGQPEGDRLLTFSLPTVQTLQNWSDQMAGADPRPYQAQDWVVVCMDEGGVDLVGGMAVQVLCLGNSREGWAPLACTGPWSPEAAQAVLEEVERYLQQPVLLV